MFKEIYNDGVIISQKELENPMIFRHILTSKIIYVTTELVVKDSTCKHYGYIRKCGKLNNDLNQVRYQAGIIPQYMLALYQEIPQRLADTLKPKAQDTIVFRKKIERKKNRK